MSDSVEPAGPLLADVASAILTDALSGLVVLDLADRALLAGRMLAQPGASVTLIEPPFGSPARHMRGPAHWAADGASRALPAIDLASPAGPVQVLALATTADILLESEEPGRLAALRRGNNDLSAINPRLIHWREPCGLGEHGDVSVFSSLPLRRSCRMA